MDNFQLIAERLIIYKLRFAWLEIAKLYNNMATAYDGTLSMGFVLLTIDEEGGIPVTKIAPRMGMEPNSLSRILKSMEQKKLIYRQKDEVDRRKVYICLTEEGTEMRNVAIKAVFKLEEALTKGLTEEQLKGFFEVANHVPDAIGRFKEELEQLETSKK